MRRFVLFISLSALIQIWAQDRVRVDQVRTPTTDRNLQAVISLARSAPPEFGADILIRLVEKGFISDRRVRRELLEQAFTLGAYAQEPSALRSVEGNGPGVFQMDRVFAEGFDAVSLRARVVRAYLRLDAQRARALFELIEPMPELHHSCSDQLTVDVSSYYIAMGELLKAIPNQETRDRIFLDHLARVRSVAQIAPFVDAVLTSKEAVNLAALTDALAERLTRLDSDDHAFTWHFLGSIEALGRLAAQAPVGSRERLIQQSRAWVLTSLNHGMCGHRQGYVGHLDGSKTPIPWRGPGERFNQTLASQSLAKNEISPRDYTMPQLGARVSIPGFSEDWHRFGAMETLLAHEPPEAKETTRWQNELAKYIELVTGWTGAQNELPVDYYFEKWDLLNRVQDMQKFYLQKPSTLEEVTAYWQKQHRVPLAEIPERDRAMIALAGLLEGSPGSSVYSERRIAWFAPVWQMIGSFDRSNRTLGFSELFVNAHNVVLNLYGRFALLAQPGAGR